MDETKKIAREQGYVTTIFGRKCHYPRINASNPSERAFNERAAINAPIQGSAADIIRRAMVRMDAALEKAGLSAQMLLQVHDELVFEVPDDEVEATIALVRASDGRCAASSRSARRALAGRCQGGAELGRGALSAMFSTVRICRSGSLFLSRACFSRSRSGRSSPGGFGMCITARPRPYGRCLRSSCSCRRRIRDRRWGPSPTACSTDYLPFILMLFAFYTTAGGIVVSDLDRATPLTNTGLLAAGTLVASLIGATARR